MKKKILALATALAISTLAVVPAFASPASEVAAAQAAQEKRNADIVAGKQRIADFAASELAKGDAAKAAGQAAVEVGQKAIAAFKDSELAKGEAAKAAGQAAAEGNPVKAFQEGQRALEEAAKAERAEVQKKVNEYLASFR